MNLRITLGLFRRAGPITRAVLDGIGHRGELALLELADARARFVATVMLGAGAGILISLGGLAATFAFAGAVWHRPDRGLLLILLAGAELLGAALLLALAANKVRGWQPFADTLRQLEEDKECLRKLIPCHPEKSDSDQP